MTDDDKLKTILTHLIADPVRAHQIVFAKRHQHQTPEFHRQIITDFWSADEYVGEMAFREAGKSTIAEEAMALMGLFGIEPFVLIVGASYERAVDRLNAIKHELENNEVIEALWGDQKGQVWNEGEIILKNGCKIQALGARSSFRGVKHNNTRPTLVFIDDLEDEKNTDTDKKRERLAKWVSRVLFPACRLARKRIAGTPLHPDCWLETMRRKAGWTFRVHPIVVPAVTDDRQWEKSNWPDRYPLEKIRLIKGEMERAGDLQGFVQEYLCKSEEAALKPFQRSHIKPASPLPPFLPSIVIVDPARSVGPKSARTGYVVFSAIGAKFVFRRAFGSYDLPNKIIDNLFALDAAYEPTWIAVEKDGLEQFLLQPIRQECTKRAAVLPIKPISAPRDRAKDSFIRGLEPFFNAGEIEIDEAQCQDLITEILNFPSGLKDVLNAAAYAPRLRGGKPVYENFNTQHIVLELKPSAHHPLWLVVNCESNYTCAALMQTIGSGFRVFGDWVQEGGVDNALDIIIRDAVQISGGIKFKFFAPREQFDEFNNVGLPRVAKRRNLEFTKGPAAREAASSLAAALREQNAAQPAFLVSSHARWTVNAMASGYARELDKAAVLTALPVPGYYATLMGGVESFAKWLNIASAPEVRDVHMETTRDGRQFISARSQGVSDGGQRLPWLKRGTG